MPTSDLPPVGPSDLPSSDPSPRPSNRARVPRGSRLELHLAKLAENARKNAPIARKEVVATTTKKEKKPRVRRTVQPPLRPADPPEIEPENLAPVSDADAAEELRKALATRRDVLFGRYIQADGNLSPAGRDFLQRPALKGIEKEMRDELIFSVWSGLSADDEAVRSIEKQTGLKKSLIEAVVRDHMKRLLFQEGGAEHLLARRLDLERVRHESRVQTIERMNDIVAKAIAQTEARLASCDAKAAATIAGIFTDKSLLLSGQPTSRIARMDERFMATDEMRVKIQDEMKRFAKMQQEAEEIGFTPIEAAGNESTPEGR